MNEREDLSGQPVADPVPRTEIVIGADTARQLVASQFPQFSHLAITETRIPGTQNTVLRLGRDMCLRIPRRQRVVGRLEKEVRWLPLVAERSPLAVPVPLAVVPPSAAFPMPWAVYRWIEGVPVSMTPAADQPDAARRLAAFIRVLQELDTHDAPASQQDKVMAERDADVRRVIPLLGSVLDTRAVLERWESLLDVPAWTGTPRWTHGDLLPTNLLVADGRLTAVIDFGCAGVGDPALDLLPAWAVFDGAGREAFRTALGADDALWRRGQTFALHQAVVMAAAYLTWSGPTLDIAVRMATAIVSAGPQGG